MATGDFSLALDTTNACWAWGNNANGSVGDGTITNWPTPVSVVGAHSFTSIAAGNHSLGLKSADGSCWAWGLNTGNRGLILGCLGDNAGVSRSSPVSVVGTHSFSSISAGLSHSLALKSDGSCWAWGYNNYGVLGDNSTNNRSSPVSVVGSHSFTSIAGGTWYALALKSADGSCWAWGYNSYGEVGDNSVANKSSPVSVVGAHSFTSIALGGNHSLALKSSDGSCWAWGFSTSYGQLGDNSVNNRSSPVSVVGGHSFKTIAGGNNHSLALKSLDGSCWAWGYNIYGQIGDNTQINRSSPVSVVGGHSFVQVTGFNNHSLALKKNGEIWAWGDDEYGQLGNNSGSADKVSPVSVVGSHSFIKIAGGFYHSLAIKSSDGSCWTWGQNNYSQLGDQTGANRSSPVSVVGGHSFTEIAGGYIHSLGLKSSNGSCWAWGDNSVGTLGNNSTTSTSSPVSVVGGHSFIAIAGGWQYSLALKADGSCWGWGYNYNSYGGQLGDGTITRRSSPVSVLGGHIFNSIAASSGHSLGLKSSDGSCWTWGDNSSGQLGTNVATSGRSSPVSVVGNHSFTMVKASNAGFSCLALKADGSCWGWGQNTYGQLGDNATIVGKSSPISVVGAHSFTSIACGTSHMLGLKSSDGSCWAWGYNASGELGDGTLVNKSSPVSVVGGHSFASISTQGYTSIGLKANGEVWSWGEGSTGELGNNNARGKFSPILVVSANKFNKLPEFLLGGYVPLTQILKLAGVAWASISKVAGVPAASIGKISGVPNA